jgi:hypothetical protein
MKIVLIFLCLCCLAVEANAVGNSTVKLLHQDCEDSVPSLPASLSSLACLQNKVYRLKYDRKLKKIILFFGKKSSVLQQIPKGLDPALVGADKLIGFLPDSLQIYRKNRILLYISSIRTNAGAGGGECGAGSEIYLNFLDVNKADPLVRSKILIGSCDYSIELDEQDVSEGKIGEISVAGDKLLLHFLNYKNMDGSPTATVTPDLKNLLFK